jgi:hypothetical protein
LTICKPHNHCVLANVSNNAYCSVQWPHHLLGQRRLGQRAVVVEQRHRAQHQQGQYQLRLAAKQQA